MSYIENTRVKCAAGHDYLVLVVTYQLAVNYHCLLDLLSGISTKTKERMKRNHHSRFNYVYSYTANLLLFLAKRRSTLEVRGAPGVLQKIVLNDNAINSILMQQPRHNYLHRRCNKHGPGPRRWRRPMRARFSHSP